MLGLAILVSIADIAIKLPKKYDPLSPRKIFAFGKLNIKNKINATIIKKRKFAKLSF